MITFTLSWNLLLSLLSIIVGYAFYYFVGMFLFFCKRDSTMVWISIYTPLVISILWFLYEVVISFGYQ